MDIKICIIIKSCINLELFLSFEEFFILCARKTTVKVKREVLYQDLINFKPKIQFLYEPNKN